jgi:formyltetrahydrofolate deformylase
VSAAGPNEVILTIECPDRLGIVHAVAGFLADNSCNIVDSQQFNDKRTSGFYMRVQAEHHGDRSIDELKASFDPVADRFAMRWSMVDGAARMNTIIMVSHTDHCLNELLDLWQSGLMPINVVGIVSNHDTLRTTAYRFGVPFHHIPVTPDSKSNAEAALLDLIESTDTELVVLARYMQILSDRICTRLPGRVINIHHSFLPGFKGANPYRQAHARGVKLIGATAHFVTSDLDEGPIIEQNVVRVDHSRTPAELVAIGQDEESRTLTQAVKWFSEHRVLLDGQRTIIFR